MITINGFKRVTAVLFVILSCLSGGGVFAQNALSVSQYTLNAGDLIQVRVFDEDELNVEARLTDAGTISYPFLGEVQVRGLTVGDLENVITAGLKGDYLVHPRVNVTIVEYRKFFVRGEVKKPGGFSYEPGLTLEKAVALAGGFTERANKKNILLSRRTGNKSSEENIALDEAVYPGDIINVEESFF